MFENVLVGVDGLWEWTAGPMAVTPSRSPPVSPIPMES